METYIFISNNRIINIMILRIIKPIEKLIANLFIIAKIRLVVILKLFVFL